MSQTTAGSTSKGTGKDVSSSNGRETGLITSQGRTSIADGVVAKIAGIATREVDGVFAVGGGAARAMGSVREAFGGKNHSQGVSVEVGERQAAVDVAVVVEYGMAIADVADGIRRNVIRSIERMTGLEVTEVNVSVGDIHIPGDENDDDDQQQPEQEPRVR
jgi:uncharacterized alkaline shock family protein YloU